MNNIKDADLMAKFPPALRQDESLKALGQIIAEELHITANEAKKNIIYANLEELSETWLDILAYDLHVDWYSYDYPVEAKRAIIRDSVKVHQKLGTKAAVEMALGGIHPLSEIEEWFDYGGTPYHFRIVLDTTKSRVTADYDEIVSTVDIYKRLTAHLDGLYYQCSMCVIVVPQTEYFLFQTPMTGRLKTGTEPHRNREGVVADTVINIGAQAAGYIAESAHAGTKPYRNIIFAVHDGEIVTDSDTEKYQYDTGITGKETTGTKPYIETVGGMAAGTVEIEPETDVTKFDSDFTGTKPYRNITAEFREVAAVGVTDTEIYGFESTQAGTKPGRNVTFGHEDVETATETEFEQYRYDTGMTGREKAGTEPYTSTRPGISDKGMTTMADTESYQFEVKRCGKNRL